jgi:hypothetical protein
VLLYTADIGRDVIEANELEHTNVFLVTVLIISTSILALMTLRGRYLTKRLIKCAPGFLFAHHFFRGLDPQ